MDAVAQLGQQFIDNLCRLSKILEGADVPFAVIGASALLLHGVDLGRTTRDLDLAVAIEGGLEATRPLLLDAGLTSTSIEHRFRMTDRSEIDILAIDPAWTPAHEIRLADGDLIHAVGLPDAVRQSVAITLGSCLVSVAPLCLLIAVKLYAATADDRHHDVEDARVALQTYESGGGRRFEVDYERFEELTFETAGAFLAGQDTAELIANDTKASILEAIQILLSAPQQTSRYADGEIRSALLHAYQFGLNSASAQEPASA